MASKVKYEDKILTNNIHIDTPHEGYSLPTSRKVSEFGREAMQEIVRKLNDENMKRIEVNNFVKTQENKKKCWCIIL